MSSLARGRHDDPAEHLPVAAPAEELDEPVAAARSSWPGRWSRAGAMTVGGHPAEFDLLRVTPTVAISGSVNTLAATVFSRSGATASPSACHMAIRPCIAATEASGSTPVQSPAA